MSGIDVYTVTLRIATRKPPSHRTADALTARICKALDGSNYWLYVGNDDDPPLSLSGPTSEDDTL